MFLRVVEPECRSYWSLEEQYSRHVFPRKPGHFFSSKSSWTPETQPTLRRLLVEFLVFNSAFGRYSWLISTLSHHHQCFVDTRADHDQFVMDATWIQHPASTNGDATYVSRMHWWWCDRVLISQLHLQKPDQSIKTSTNPRRKAPLGWVSGVQLDSQNKKDPPNVENRVMNDPWAFREKNFEK